MLEPTTVSHNGGCADQPGARMPRCTPTGPSHAASLSCRADGRPYRPALSRLSAASSVQPQLITGGRDLRPPYRSTR